MGPREDDVKVQERIEGTGASDVEIEVDTAVVMQDEVALQE